MDFKFNGMPDNDYFDNGEEETSQGQISDIEKLKEMLENEGISDEDLKNVKSFKISSDDLKNSSSMFNKLMSTFLQSIANTDLFGDDEEECDGDCDNCDEDCGEDFPEYELGKYTTLTDPENFAAVQCIESDSLYTDFEEKYGVGPWDVSSMNNKTSLYGSKIDIDAGSKLKYVCDTEKYILFLVEPATEGKSSVYIAAIKDPETNDFAFIVPAYGNVYDPETEEIFTAEKYPEYFDKNGAFIFSDIAKVKCGLNACLSTVKKTIINIEDFGTVKPRRKSYSEPSKYLLIGSITSNDSSKANMLKKDAGFTDDENTFDLYIKYNEEISPEILNSISEWYSKLDFNSTLFVKNNELYTDDGMLYVKGDYDKYLQNLPFWKNSEGNWDIK